MTEILGEGTVPEGVVPPRTGTPTEFGYLQLVYGPHIFGDAHTLSEAVGERLRRGFHFTEESQAASMPQVLDQEGSQDA